MLRQVGWSVRIAVVFVVLGSASTQSQVQPFSVRIDRSRVLAQPILAEYDSLYVQAGLFVSGDSISAAWYQSFRPSLEKHIEAAGFTWVDTTFVWIQLCCSPTGKVEHVLFRSRTLDSGKIGKQFQSELESFARGYVFPIRADRRYSQCGTFRFPIRRQK